MHAAARKGLAVLQQALRRTWPKVACLDDGFLRKRAACVQAALAAQTK